MFVLFSNFSSNTHAHTHTQNKPLSNKKINNFDKLLVTYIFIHMYFHFASFFNAYFKYSVRVKKSFFVFNIWNFLNVKIRTWKKAIICKSISNFRL